MSNLSLSKNNIPPIGSGNKRIRTFPKSISLKMNVIARLEFELRCRILAYEPLRPGDHTKSFIVSFDDFYSGSICRWVLEYTNYIPCRGQRTPTNLDMILNSVWCCGSCSGDLGSVEYLFIAFTSRFTQTRNVRVSSTAEIDLLKIIRIR